MEREDALGAIEASCRQEAPFYGSNFRIAFDRPDADTFEMRAERTSLMSLGDDACRFRVVRTGDPLAFYTDALDQRFGGGQAAG